MPGEEPERSEWVVSSQDDNAQMRCSVQLLPLYRLISCHYPPAFAVAPHFLLQYSHVSSMLAPDGKKPGIDNVPQHSTRTA